MLNNKTHRFKPMTQLIARFCKTLSHPARIEIIKILAQEKEVKTVEIGKEFPISRSTISRHLKEMLDGGLLKGEVNGKNVHYCLNQDKFREMRKELNKIFDIIDYSFECECEKNNKKK